MWCVNRLKPQHSLLTLADQEEAMVTKRVYFYTGDDVASLCSNCLLQKGAWQCTAYTMHARPNGSTTWLVRRYINIWGVIQRICYTPRAALPTADRDYARDCAGFIRDGGSYFRAALHVLDAENAKAFQ